MSYLQKYFYHVCIIVCNFIIKDIRSQISVWINTLSDLSDVLCMTEIKKKCNFEHSKFFDQIVNLSLTLTFCSCKWTIGMNWTGYHALCYAYNGSKIRIDLKCTLILTQNIFVVAGPGDSTFGILFFSQCTFSNWYKIILRESEHSGKRVVIKFIFCQWIQ